MTTGDIILHIFCIVDDSLPDIPKHPQSKLYPSELVTIGIRHSLQSQRWLLSRLLPLVETRLWRLIWPRAVTGAHTSATSAQDPSSLV